MTINEDRFIAEFIADMSFGSEVIVPPGDDCAGIAGNDNTVLLIAVDQLALNSHYDTDTNPEHAGRKLLARNISDIAAMGGEPLYALLAIASRKSRETEDLVRFANGVKQLASEYGIAIIGGDLAGAESDVSSLTIIGSVS